MPRAVLFDFDGVIADSEPLHYETFAEVLAAEGIDLPRERNDREYIGIDLATSFRKAFRDAGRHLEEGRLGDLIARKSRLFLARLNRVRLFPGIPELVRAASDRCACAIVSGTLRAEILGLLHLHGLEGRISLIVAADDGLPSKPAPDGYLRGLHDLRGRAELRDLAASDCLVVEDSVPGIRAARAAGMRCIALAHSHPAALLGEAHFVFASAALWEWSVLE